MSFKYIKEGDKRPIASVVVCGRVPSIPEQPEPVPVTPDEEPPEQIVPPEESEDTPVEENKKEESVTEVVKDETWTDPEPVQNEHIIMQRIASLMSLKSIITLALTAAFIDLVVNNKDLPDDFVNIYTMCISFFFGYQFKKAEGGGDK